MKKDDLVAAPPLSLIDAGYILLHNRNQLYAVAYALSALDESLVTTATVNQLCRIADRLEDKANVVALELTSTDGVPN